MALPTPDERRAVRVIYRDGEPMAALLFDRSLEDERELLDAVAATAGIALENGRLRAELRARLQELQGSRVRVFEASRQERQRLERDLHDGAQQRLVALSLELGLLVESAAADPELSGTAGAAPRVRCRRRWRSSAMSPAASTPRCWAATVSPSRWSRPGRAGRLPVALEIDLPDRLPPRSRWPPTTSSARR